MHATYQICWGSPAVLHERRKGFWGWGPWFGSPPMEETWCWVYPWVPPRCPSWPGTSLGTSPECHRHPGHTWQENKEIGRESQCFKRLSKNKKSVVLDVIAQEILSLQLWMTKILFIQKKETIRLWWLDCVLGKLYSGRISGDKACVELDLKHLHWCHLKKKSKEIKMHVLLIFFSVLFP